MNPPHSLIIQSGQDLSHVFHTQCTHHFFSLNVISCRYFHLLISYVDHVISHTVTPRNTGRQGTNKFHLLLADFCYCQYRKLKEMSRRDQGLAFVFDGFPLLLGPVLRGLTVY